MEITDSHHPNIQVNKMDGIKIFIVQNVESVTTTPPLYDRLYIRQTVEGDDTFIFVIDMGRIPAFGHWVYESVIYIPVYKRLKETNPTMKLMIGSYKPYKELYIHYFGLDMQDVVYSIPLGSTCMIPSPTYSLTRKDISREHQSLIENIIPSIYVNIKDGFTFFPREDTNNYEGNNHMKISFRSIVDFMDRTGIPYSVYNTSATSSLLEQIEKVQHSKVILIPDGSAFLVNGVFARDSIIYVVGRLCSKQHAILYPQIGYIVSLIESKNTVYYFQTDADCIEYLRSGIYKEPIYTESRGTLEFWNPTNC